MIKIANNLNDMIVKQALKSKDLVDMDSFGGMLTDYLPAAGWNMAGESRPGRATAMAESIGKDPGFFVKYPLTSGGLLSVPLSIGGALAGAAATGAFNGEMDTPQLLGIGGGGLAGILLGNLISGGIRRSQMKEIAEEFDATKSKSIKAKNLDGSLHLLDENPFMPFSGAHELGRAEAIQAIRGNLDASEVGDYGGKPYIAFGGDALGSALAAGLPLGYFGTRLAAKYKAESMLKNKKKKKK